MTNTVISTCAATGLAVCTALWEWGFISWPAAFILAGVLWFVLGRYFSKLSRDAEGR